MIISEKTRGMATPLVLAVILALAAVAGAVYFAMQNRVDPMNNVTGGSVEEERMTEGEDDEMMSDETTGTYTPFNATGEVLAGTTTPFVNFNRADYEKALRENRVVLLYFYANWCPICRVELSRTEAAFDDLQLSNVVGFRVSYNDNETDDYEENLARQFGVAYQHTKVILKGGQQVLKNGETWSKDRYINELTAAAR